MSYLAYPGTLGAPYMDYILADRIVIPQQEQQHYSEKIAWLPHSYQINDDKRAIAEKPSRAEAGLPADGFVFCNFNHANKFTPESFTLWLRLLAQVPGSVLWLLKPDPLAVENLRREAQARGIEPARLIFAEHLPFEKHLARLALADLFLDGLPYGAHTTASDALWAGLPLVTWRGTGFCRAGGGQPADGDGSAGTGGGKSRPRSKAWRCGWRASRKNWRGCAKSWRKTAIPRRCLIPQEQHAPLSMPIGACWNRPRRKALP